MTINTPTYLPSPNKKPLTPVKLLVVIILFLIGAILHGCSPEKRAARLDKKSLDRVVTNPVLLNDAANAYLQVHPCLETVTIDSVVIKHDTLPAKVIKIPYPVTQFKTKIIDTLIDGISVYADSTGIVVKNLNGVVTDSVIKYITKVDQSLVNRLMDSLVEKGKLITYYQGKYEELQDQKNELSKENTKLHLIIIGLSVILILSLFFNVKGLIGKIALPSLSNFKIPKL
jgi:hypothetical protein